MRRALCQLVLAVCLNVPLFAAAPPALTLAFGESSVTVDGADPKSTVYVYQLAREPKGYVSRVVSRDAKLRDDDGDGRVVWSFDAPLPLRSFWLAVDLESGRYVAGVPEGYVGAERIELTGRHLGKDSSGEVQQLAADGSMIEVVAVRPKSGAVWSATVTSLGTLDEGREHGRVSFSASKLVPRDGADGAPKSLRPDDVVLIVNSFAAQYGVARVGDWR